MEQVETPVSRRGDLAETLDPFALSILEQAADGCAMRFTWKLTGGLVVAGP